MRCLHINIRQATFMVLCIIINNVNVTQMADNKMEISKKDPTEVHTPKPAAPSDHILHCPTGQECTNLLSPCVECDFNSNCVYGQLINRTCKVTPTVECKGPREFERQLICRYCYQTEPWEHSCELKANCNSVASPRVYYVANCTVDRNISCLGQRTFNKNVKCNWTGGYRWTTALALSITLGGFGADRFYLGHWQEGIGKLFSFGGLGVWTIIDVILISLHYLGPADGSLYI